MGLLADAQLRNLPGLRIEPRDLARRELREPDPARTVERDAVRLSRRGVLPDLPRGGVEPADVVALELSEPYVALRIHYRSVGVGIRRDAIGGYRARARIQPAHGPVPAPGKPHIALPIDQKTVRLRPLGHVPLDEFFSLRIETRDPIGEADGDVYLAVRTHRRHE